MKQIVLNNIMSVQMRFFEAFFTWKTNDLVSEWNGKFKEVASTLQQLAPGIAVICIIISGIMIMSGRKGADQGKGWLLYIFAGVAIIFSALSIYNWITGGLPTGAL